ncbi:MAG: hypothetical protein M3348_03860, partial [Acidobacteriota bacterium]|nr:hypothetical protein [Acidobacteriota bacterium]
MADLRRLPAEALRTIAIQIGDRIAEELSSSASAVPPRPVGGAEQALDFWPLADVDPATARFKLAETFEVWKLRDDACDQLASTREDLVTLARPTGAYRHQIRLVRDGAETAVAFAQSYAAGPNPNERVVRDFFFSPLAEHVDEAVKAADKLIPEAAVTRLLSLPEFKVEALWFVTLSDAAEHTRKRGAAAQPTRSITTRGVMVACAPYS